MSVWIQFVSSVARLTSTQYCPGSALLVESQTRCHAEQMLLGGIFRAASGIY
jgi:hypothetical protein